MKATNRMKLSLLTTVVLVASLATPISTHVMEATSCQRRRRTSLCCAATRSAKDHSSDPLDND
jgi:hypothetical protein